MLQRYIKGTGTIKPLYLRIILKVRTLWIVRVLEEKKPPQNLNSLAVNICQQAQQKKQEVEAKQNQEQIALQETPTQTGSEIGTGNLSSSPGNRQNGGGELETRLFWVLRVVAAGALALKTGSNEEKKLL